MALRKAIAGVVKGAAHRAVRVPTVRHLLKRMESLARDEQHEEQEKYGGYWDFYVERQFPDLLQRDASGNIVFVWPGDEWGDEKFWRNVFDTLFKQHVPPESTRFVEIGPGSGKYALMVLEAWPKAALAAFDVSKAYLKVLEKRCAPLIEQGRLHSFVIKDQPDVIDRGAGQLSWAGEIDCLFSMDAMVHVDLQYLMAYWLSAARMLRIGGKLIMSVADATNKGGYEKLLRDVPVWFSMQGKMCPKFEWLSPQLVEHLLGQLGFVLEARHSFNERDLYFVARLERRVSL